jgi:hypothetical protein
MGSTGKRDFQYHRLYRSKHPFSFIINQDYLLFYIRDLSAVDSNSINQIFDVHGNHNDELTIRINNIEDAIIITQ